MAVIEQVLTLVDETVSGIGGTVYADVVGAVDGIVLASSVLLVALVGANLMTQTVQMSYSTALGLFMRLVLINIFLDYDNFIVPYEALTNAPSEFGAGMLSALSDESVGDLYAGLDSLYVRALNVGDAISDSGGWVTGAMAGLAMFLLAALMATITIIVMSAAKIMLAVLLAIVPLVICCTFFKQTAPLFESWVKLAIGFSVIPLFVAAMAGFTIATAVEVTPPDLSDIETLSAALSFIVVMMLGAGLMALVPNFAQSLASTNIGIGAVAGRAIQYPGDALRTSFYAGKGGIEGAKGQSASNRYSMAAQTANYTARAGRVVAIGGAKATVALAGKMKRSGSGTGAGSAKK